jgi:hypothetical protein
LFEKFERRQPPSPKRRLSASRRVAKNQCADKGFLIAHERRVRERQFALSCLSSSLVSSVHNPILKYTRSLSGMRQNAIVLMAEDTLFNRHGAARAEVGSASNIWRGLVDDLRRRCMTDAQQSFSLAYTRR